MDKGLLYGLVAYSMWGFFPLYWRFLTDVPAAEILANRILWSLGFLALLLTLRKAWGWVGTMRSQPRYLMPIALAAGLLAVNWFIYIWAINAGFVVETSLGYFINPLVNVLLGVVLLGERLRSGQWLAIGIATLGVLYLTLTYGSLPWIALTLAFTFGFYGLIKKKQPLGSVNSLAAEMSMLFLPALAYQLVLFRQGSAALGQGDPLTTLLLVGAGPVTAIPLLFFAGAARRIPLSTLGLLQYIAPTLQFLIGIYVFREPFTPQRLVGFCIIWLALVVYTAESIRFRRQQAALPAD